MKQFEEYTMSEKESIIRKGGNNKKELRKALNAWLDGLDLDKDIRSIVNSTDPVEEVFGLCNSIEDVIAIAKEYEEV